MLNEPTSRDVMDQQQEIVRRYADQLKRQACAGSSAARFENARRCYQLLNDCALELADVGRARDPRVGEVAPTN